MCLNLNVVPQQCSRKARDGCSQILSPRRHVRGSSSGRSRQRCYVLPYILSFPFPVFFFLLFSFLKTGKLRDFDRCDRLASSSESVQSRSRVGRHGYGAGEETDPFLCTRPTTLELWLIHPSSNLYKAGSLLGTNTLVGKRALFQTATSYRKPATRPRSCCRVHTHGVGSRNIV